MLERIVAAIDRDPSRSEKVVDAAKELAAARGGSVLVAHVRELERPTPAMLPAARGAAVAPVAHMETEERARELVENAVATLSAAAITATGKVGPASGSTARELLAIAREFDATVIVVGDRGTHVTDVLLGSVANRIMHLAPCPVLLVR